MVVNSTTNLLKQWHVISKQGYLTFYNLTQFYLPFRLGEQYSIIKGKWDNKIVKILDQENQIIQENYPQFKPDPISSFILDDTIYIYTPDDITQYFDYTLSQIFYRTNS